MLFFDFDRGVKSLLFVRAFGFHMLGHLPLHILQHGCLSCWCLERKHKEAKVFMNSHHVVTESWDLEVLKSITENVYWKLSGSPNFLRNAGLIEPVPLKRGAFGEWFEAEVGAEVLHSSRCRIGAGCICSTGDVVIIRQGDLHSACQVKHFFECSGFAFAIVCAMEFCSQDSFDARVSVHVDTANLMYVDIASVKAMASRWLATAHGVRVVVPAWLCCRDGFARERS